LRVQPDEIERGLRIVAFAYACEPDKGSEPGAGWVWAQMLTSLGQVWVVTRANNRPAIEAALPGLDSGDKLHFVYVDLPRWARFWKRGQRGVRLYYLLWQIAALVRARRLHRRERFDLTWHLTLANAWLGSTAALVGPEFVYGPVGGGVGTSWRLLPTLGGRGIAYEVIRAWVRFGGRYLNPLARLAWMRSRLILAQNGDLESWLPARHRSKVRVFPNAVLGGSPLPSAEERSPSKVAVFAGRLLPWKGVAIGIRAIVGLPDWRLVVCGSGRDERRLRRLAKRLGVGERVEFRGWLTRERLHDIMCSEADAFLFPSLHDEAGWVVVEALAAGLPVICLGIGGPPALIGQRGRVVSAEGDQTTVVRQVAEALNAAVTPAARQAARERSIAFLRGSVETRLRDLVRSELPEYEACVLCGIGSTSLTPLKP
jgi:glycosyltransferase involved in cell wall biosynthesis